METIYWLYLIFASISLLCSTFLLVVYKRHPMLRVFPLNLVMWRSLADWLCSLQLIVQTIVIHYSNTEDIDAVDCRPFSFFFQFSQTASLGWYAALALNYYFALSNPYKNPKTRNLRYHVVVWSLAIITGSLAASRASYRQNFGLCYTEKTSGLNFVNWASFFAWLLLAEAAAVFVLIDASNRLRKTDPKFLETRSVMLNLTLKNVIGFTIFWTVLGVIYFVIYRADNDGDGTNSSGAYEAFAVVLSSLGTVDFVLWNVTQRDRYKESIKYYTKSDRMSRRHTMSVYARINARQDISSEVRKEFIDYTTKGIQEAIKQHKERESKRGRLQIKRESYGAVGETHMLFEDSGSDVSRTPRPSVIKPTKPLPIILRSKGNNSSEIKFQDYAPNIFHQLRTQVFKCSTDQYLASLVGDGGDSLAKMQEQFTEGRSGSFFYWSPDKRFIVKTLNNTDFTTLFTKIIPKYLPYMAKMRERLAPDGSQSFSLLTKFYGLYSIQIYGITQYFVVMENCFWTGDAHAPKLHERYDLKGSWINRSTNLYDDASAVRKDNDFKYTLNFPHSLRRKIYAQVLFDIQFLCSMNIMDYSMLVGVHRCTELRDPHKPHCSALNTSYPVQNPNDDEKRASSKYPDHLNIVTETLEGPGIYSCGIIDMFQIWNANKVAEHWAKRLLRFQDAYAMSAIPPRPYAERFILMMADHLQMSVASTCSTSTELRIDVVDMRRPIYGDPEYRVRLVVANDLVVERWEPITLIRREAPEILDQVATFERLTGTEYNNEWVGSV